MYLLYLDESGDPSSWQGHRHFVISGVAVYEGEVDALTKQLTQVQEQYIPGVPIPIPFHATDLRRGKGDFENLSLNVRRGILESVYKIILDSRFPDLIVFGAVLSIDSAKDFIQARHDTFEEACSRFNNFLIWQHRSGHTSKGLVILDRNREEHYRQHLSAFKRSTKYGYLGNVVDIPYFAKCRDTRMLQLADFCANAIFRHYEKQDNEGMSMILPRIYRLPSSQKLDGLGHITTNQNCKCLACSSQARKL
jgi:hypothetical protein